MKLHIRMVTTHTIHEYVDRALEVLRPSMEISSVEITPQILKHYLLTGKCRLITVITSDNKMIAAAVLDIVTYPTGNRVLTLPVVAGERMPEWMANVLILAENYAEKNNCIELRGYAQRDGWLRALGDTWEPVYQVVRKSLKH